MCTYQNNTVCGRDHHILYANTCAWRHVTIILFLKKTTLLTDYIRRFKTCSSPCVYCMKIATDSLNTPNWLQLFSWSMQEMHSSYMMWLCQNSEVSSWVGQASGLSGAYRHLLSCLLLQWDVLIGSLPFSLSLSHFVFLLPCFSLVTEVLAVERSLSLSGSQRGVVIWMWTLNTVFGLSGFSGSVQF